MRATVAFIGLAMTLAMARAATQPAPMPEREAFFAATRQNLARSQADQWQYAYKERRSELHTNPFGKIGTGGTVTYDVTPGPERGVIFRRVIERDGKAVTGSPLEKQDRRSNRPRTSRSGLDDVVDTLELSMDRREQLDGRTAIVIQFAPRRGAEPQTREGRMAAKFKGSVWVDEGAREVVRIEATALDDISYGLGLLARLNEGSTVRLSRQRIDDAMWLPTSIRFTGQGRALLFRKLNVDYAIDWFDYKKTPDLKSD